MAGAFQSDAFQNDAFQTSGATTYNRTCADSLSSITESVSRVATYARTVSAALATLTESVARVATMPRTLADSLSTLTEAVVRIKSIIRTISDSVSSITETVSRAAMSVARAVADTISSISEYVNVLSTPYVAGPVVYVGGTAISSPIALPSGVSMLFATASFESAVNGAVGTAKFRVRDDSGTAVFTTGQVLELVIDGNRVWTGFVTSVTRVYVFPVVDVAAFGTTRFFDIEGTDLNILFTKRVVYNKANAASVFGKLYGHYEPDAPVIEDLVTGYLDLSGDALDTSTYVENVADINQDQDARAWSSGYTWGQAMQSIAMLPGAVFFIDPYRRLIYTDVNTASAPYPMTDQPGPGDAGYREMELIEDGTSLANDVLAWGLGYGSTLPVFTRDTDATSQSVHGLWQTAVTTFGVYKQATNDRIAASIIDGSPSNKRGAKNDKTAVTVTTYQPGFLPAQKVDFSSGVFGFTDIIPIRKMRVTFEAPNNPKYELTISHDIDSPWSFFDQYLLRLPQLISPPPPPPPPPPPGGCDCGITDTFTRTVAPNGWGTSDASIPYATSVAGSGTPSGSGVLSVDGSEGTLLLPAKNVSGASSAQAILPFSLPTSSMTFDFFIVQQPTVTGINASSTGLFWQMRLNDNRFVFRVNRGHNSSTGATINSIALGAWAHATTIDPYSFSTGLWYSARWEMEFGVEARLRIWDRSTTEPGTWTITVTDSGDAVPAAGNLEILGLSVADAILPIGALEVLFDNFNISGVDRCTENRFDNFDRTNGFDWGYASSGALYTETSTDPGFAVASVNGSEGLLTAIDSSGIVENAPLPAPNAPFTMTVAFRLSNIPTLSPDGGYNVLNFFFRSGVDYNFLFQMFIQDTSVNDGGDAYVELASFPGSSVQDYSFNPSNTSYMAKLEFDGVETYRCKVWQAVDPEPGTWLLTNTGGVPVDNFDINWGQTITDGATRTVHIDYIDFDYTGKPCYQGGPPPGGGSPVFDAGGSTGFGCETPIRTSSTVYTVSNQFQPFSTIVYKNGLFQRRTFDYDEDAGGTSVTFASATSPTDVVRACYKLATLG